MPGIVPGFARRPEPAPFPLDDPARTVLLYGGRQAIYRGVRLLGLEVGERILVPSYCCGSEIDALLRAGLTLEFYKVGADLQPDLLDIEARCSKDISALYVTHFLGFAQPMDELLEIAARHGVPLIEDNAHGFLSRDEQGRPLGGRGDIGIFSFTKCLGLPDGGALTTRLAGEIDKVVDGLVAPQTTEVVTRLVKRVKSFANARAGQLSPRLVVGLDRRLVHPLKNRIRARDTGSRSAGESESAGLAEIGLEPAKVSWAASRASRWLLGRQRYSAIVGRRRDNFAYLLKHLEPREEARPIIRALPVGVCPLCFPIRSSRVEKLATFLRGHGIMSEGLWTDFHPAFPYSDFPVANTLKREVLALPIHQDLDLEDMSYTLECLARWR